MIHDRGNTTAPRGTRGAKTFSACRDLSRVPVQPFLKFVCGSCSLLRAPSYALAEETSLYFLARFRSRVAVCVFSTLGCT